jgi:cytochrome c556
MRSVVTLVIGLLVGALLTVIALNNLRRGTAYPNGVMAVMAAQMGQLDRQVKAKACSAADLEAPLGTLLALGNDLEPAFLPTADDAAFSRYAGDYRTAVERAAGASPARCEDATAALDAISAACKACHQQFKN